MRLLAVGYFGEGNTGDDLLLARLATEAAEALDDVEVAATWGTESPWEAPTETIPRNLDAVREHLDSFDAVVIGPGGILHNAAGYGRRLRDRGIAYYDAVTAAAAEADRPVAAVAIGLGPVAGTTAQRIIQRLLARCRSVSVRDPDSARLTGRPDTIVVPDLAIVPRSTEPPVRGRLAVNLRYWGDARRQRDLVERLSTAIEALVARGLVSEVVATPLSVSSDPALDDRRATHELLTGLGGSVTLSRAEITQPDDVETILRSASGVLTMRLHGAIVAAGVQRPAVGLSYDAKVANATAGLAVEAVPLDAPSSAIEAAVAEAMTTARTPAVTADHGECRSQIADLAVAGPASDRSGSGPTAIEGVRIALGA